MIPRVYVIIVNYNGWKHTIECLESVLRSDYSSFQVVVVDNGSTDSSIEHVIAWAKGAVCGTPEGPQLEHLTHPPTVKPIEYVLYECGTSQDVGFRIYDDENRPLILIRSQENRGFAAGNNIGMNYALTRDDAEYVWLLNNDTVIEANTLRTLAQKAIEYREMQQLVGIIGAKLLYYDQPNMVQGVAGLYNKWFATSRHLGVYQEDKGQFDNEEVVCKMSYPIGASLFVSAAFIKDVGLMCEDYFLYFEEIDWVIRGKNKGWKLGYCWQARVFHKEGRSTGASPNKLHKKSKEADFYGIRNRIIITKAFYPRQLWIVKSSLILVIINRLRRRQFDRLWMLLKSYKRVL